MVNPDCENSVGNQCACGWCSTETASSCYQIRKLHLRTEALFPVHTPNSQSTMDELEVVAGMMQYGDWYGNRMQSFFGVWNQWQ